MTSTQALMGSPLYMSPEQLRSSKNVDRRADIWSMGVILYEMFGGRSPFEADTLPEVCARIMAEPPPALGIHQAGASTGARARVVMRCLEKDPQRRFPDVASLAQALAPFGPPEARAIAERIARARAGRARRASPDASAGRERAVARRYRAGAAGRRADERLVQHGAGRRSRSAHRRFRSPSAAGPLARGGARSPSGSSRRAGRATACPGGAEHLRRRCPRSSRREPQPSASALPPAAADGLREPHPPTPAPTAHGVGRAHRSTATARPDRGRRCGGRARRSPDRRLARPLPRPRREAREHERLRRTQLMRRALPLRPRRRRLSPARAQRVPQSKEDVARADALFNAAKALTDAGQYADACAKYAESKRLAPGIGVTHVPRRLLRAHRAHGERLDRVSERRGPRARARRQARGRRPGARAGARAEARSPDRRRRADRPAGGSAGPARRGPRVAARRWGLPVPVDPGDHAVVVTAPGHPTRTFSAHVGPEAPNATIRIDSLDEASRRARAASRLPPRRLAPRDREPRRPWTPGRAALQRAAPIPGRRGATSASASAALGVAVSASGSIFGIVAKQKLDQSNSRQCNASTDRCYAARLPDAQGRRARRDGSDIGFIVGGVLLAAGAVVYFTAPKAPYDDGHRRRARADGGRRRGAPPRDVLSDASSSTAPATARARPSASRGGPRSRASRPGRRRRRCRCARRRRAPGRSSRRSRRGRRSPSSSGRRGRG